MVTKGEKKRTKFGDGYFSKALYIKPPAFGFVWCKCITITTIGKSGFDNRWFDICFGTAKKKYLQYDALIIQHIVSWIKLSFKSSFMQNVILKCCILVLIYYQWYLSIISIALAVWSQIRSKFVMYFSLIISLINQFNIKELYSYTISTCAICNLYSSFIEIVFYV